MKGIKQKQIAIILFFAAIAVVGLLIYKSAIHISFFLFVLFIFAILFVGLIKQRKQSDEVVKINEERFQIALSHISEIIFDNVLEADITEDILLGENAKKLTGLLNLSENSSYTQTIGAISEKLVKAEFSESYRETLSKQNLLAHYAKGETSLEYECIERSDGENYGWIRLHICIFFSKVTETVRIISYVKNIDNERKKFENLLKKAETDPLTGLYNRLSTIEATQSILDHDSGKMHAVFMIDVDNFKNINDTYGHVAGDTVLMHIAKTLKGLFRVTDIVGRFGGDEFLVFMADVQDYSVVEEKAEEVCKESRVLEFGAGVSQHISLSIGIAIASSNDVRDFNALYHQADMALYEAKEKGKDQFCFYNEVQHV